MSSSVITVKLGHKILPGRVTVGNYESTRSIFTAATHGERILLLDLKKVLESTAGSIRKVQDSPDSITFLNINQPISCLCAGPIEKLSDRSFLFVGTMSTIFGYDVENNKDLFYKEVPDGVNVVITGSLGGVPKAEETPIVIVGGNCSLQGFDSEGNDAFWTVTGDNVGAIAMLDFDDDGRNEMIVGSDDFDIRVFKGDQIIGETSETDAISCITPLYEAVFAYALVNGTIGVYEKLQRLWRIKSKNYAISICAYDFDGDGVPELVTGWSNGKLDIRNVRNGEVLFKDNFTCPLAGICTFDIYQDGHQHLISCDIEGELKVYRSFSQDGKKMPYISANVEQEALRELSLKKHNLILELRNYNAEQLRRSSIPGVPTIASVASESSLRETSVGTIPAKTQLEAAFAINMGSEDVQSHIEITLSTNNDTVIRAILIFAEGIFPGECHVVHPKEEELSSKLTSPLRPPKNVAIDLHMKAYIGFKDSTHFHVFELTRQLPRFSMYAIVKKDEKPKTGIKIDCNSFVKMPIQERPQRISIWMTQNFLMGKDIEFKGPFSILFSSLRNNEELLIEVEGNGFITIRTFDMDLTGDLVQSLCQFLNVTDLETEVDFPEEVAQLEMLLQSVEEYQESNDRLGAEIADQSTLIKTLLIRAEDARMIGDSKAMRKWYAKLHEINRSLITQHKIRCTTNENVMDSVKLINQIIQKAARLRVGRPKANIITACRESLKNHNIEALVRIIKHGVATASE